MRGGLAGKDHQGSKSYHYDLLKPLLIVHLSACPRPQQVRGMYGDDWERLGRMSIIEDGTGDK